MTMFRKRGNSPRKPLLFYGYIIIFAGVVIQTVGWGIGNSLGVFFDPLIREFAWSRAGLSGALSLGFLVHGCASIVLGNLNDRFGPRIIMSACGIILGLGYLMAARIEALWQLYVFYGLIAGAGLGGIDVIPLSTLSRWFTKQRGIMTGIVKVGTGIGMFAMPLLINWLITDFGWRRSFTVLGVMTMTAIVCLAQVLVRDPAQKGLAIDNRAKISSRGEKTKETGLNLKAAFHTRQFRIICLVYFIILFCACTIIIHLVQHAIDLGIPSSAAAGILSILGGASIAGRLVMGGAGDRMGEVKALLVCLFCLILSVSWLLAAKALWMFYLFALVYGFAHGGFFSLSAPLIASFFGTRHHGALFGIVIFSSTLGGAIGPLLAGMVYDISSSYRLVFFILAGLSSAAMGLTATLKPVLRAPSAALKKTINE